MNLAAMRREEEEAARAAIARGQGKGPEGQGQEVEVLIRLHRDLRAQGAPLGRRDLRPHLGLQEQREEAHQGGPERRV